MKQFYLDITRKEGIELVTSTDFQKLLIIIHNLKDEDDVKWELKTFPSVTLKEYYTKLE